MIQHKLAAIRILAQTFWYFVRSYVMALVLGFLPPKALGVAWHYGYRWMGPGWYVLNSDSVFQFLTDDLSMPRKDAQLFQSPEEIEALIPEEKK